MSSDIVIAGIGQVPVGEHWELPLHTLSTRALQAARKDAGGLKPQALYIGNLLAPVLDGQSNLGAHLSEHAGLSGIEAYTVEAAGASGAAALRVAYLAVKSGFVDVAAVVGVEKCTDGIGAEAESALAETMDYDFEFVPGLSVTGQAALLMQRYLYEYQAPREAFAEFPLQAHANAAHNPYAMFRKPIRREAYLSAEPLADPLNLFDAAPTADGAAALILTRRELVPAGLEHALVAVRGSAAAIDTLALHDRRDPLEFRAAAYSVESALRQAGIQREDVDFFELCDAYSIYAALSLEAAGFAPRGQGWRLAENGGLSLTGKLPISTLGGWKARGNPIGASGAYQAVEAALQLRGQAGGAQVNGARWGLIQALGGPASTAVAHVLQLVE